MAKFIQLNHVLSEYCPNSLINRKEKTEPMSINVDAIEYVSNAKKPDDLVTIARGYIRAKNCDFRVKESYEEIMNLIKGNYDANN